MDVPSESLIEKADQLVLMANSVAVASLNSAEKILGLPHALTEDMESWAFFLTIAGVVFASRLLANRVSPDTMRIVGARIRNNLDEWNPNGSRGFEDCQQFVDRSHKSQIDKNDHVKLGDVLGMWILWNLYSRAPTLEESSTARQLGGFLVSIFSNWWD